MFYSLLIFSGLIVVLEEIPLLSSKKKDWKTILVINILLVSALFVAGLIHFELLEIPTLAKMLNELLNLFFPGYCKFMKT